MLVQELPATLISYNYPGALDTRFTTGFEYETIVDSQYEWSRWPENPMAQSDSIISAFYLPPAAYQWKRKRNPSRYRQKSVGRQL